MVIGGVIYITPTPCCLMYLLLAFDSLAYCAVSALYWNMMTMVQLCRWKARGSWQLDTLVEHYAGQLDGFNVATHASQMSTQSLLCVEICVGQWYSWGSQGCSQDWPKGVLIVDVLISRGSPQGQGENLKFGHFTGMTLELRRCLSPLSPPCYNSGSYQLVVKNSAITTLPL